MDGNTWMHMFSAKRFLTFCKDKFDWGDLSSDVMMDAGCGVEGYCGKTIVKMFPDIGTIIGIEKDPLKIEYVVADIENRESLRNYEGKMTKVLSAHVFHRFVKKDEAFRNVYRLLKPGGQAAIMFPTKCFIYDWFIEMLKVPRWRDSYRGQYIEELYKKGFRDNKYKQMALKIGFQECVCIKETERLEYLTDELCKNALYELVGNSFNIPPELLNEFKEESFQVLLKLSKRDKAEKPSFIFRLLVLFLVKPKECPDSVENHNVAFSLAGFSNLNS